MRLFRIALLLCTAAMMHGCATVKPTTLPENFWKEPAKNISVSVQALPQPTSSKLGAQGLLDMAINQAVASGWDAHVKAMTFEPYPELSGEFVKRLGQRGFAAKPVSLKLAELPKYTAKPEQKKAKAAVLDKDVSGVADLAGSDYLLLVNPVLFGTARSYYGFVPLTDPSGYFVGYAALVDVKTNEIKWWKDLVVNKMTNIPWDQPPGYPNLSQAIDQAVEESKQLFLTELFKSAPAATAAAPAADTAPGAAAPATAPAALPGTAVTPVAAAPASL